LAYLKGLLSSVERKNNWQLAEQAGDATPDERQRLATYQGATNVVHDDLRTHVSHFLHDPQVALVL
jgi:predicted esterase YcpF (UPF0227 family)